MSFTYIRRTYGVLAFRGMRVKFNGVEGVITSAIGSRLRVRLDGNKRLAMCHPLWGMEYLVAQPGAKDLAVEAVEREVEG